MKTAGLEISHGSENTVCSETEVCRHGETEEEGCKQQQGLEIMADTMRKIKVKGRKTAKNSWWVSELLAAGCEKARFHTEFEDTMQQWYTWFHERNEKGEEKGENRSTRS